MKEKKNKNVKKIFLPVLVIILLAGVIYIGFYFWNKTKSKKIIEELTPTQEEIKANPEKSEEQMKLEKAIDRNSEVIGWVKIEGTDIDYPVLKCNDNDYYIDHNYKKEYDVSGSPFLDKDFDMENGSSNYLIYGHNNRDGSGQFHQLLNYKDESFYTEHPTIKFTTTNGDSEYEIISAFYSRVFYKSEKNVFRYYYFVNAETEEEYNNYIEDAKKESIYDTGKTASYGEQLLTLSTCEFSQEDGRFAVVARRK